MPFIPPKVQQGSIINSLQHLLQSQGKVGDRYDWIGDEPLITTVRSNRLSVFDFVLPIEVLKKGEVLTAMTDFWERGLLHKMGVKTHLACSALFPDQNMAKDLHEQFPDIDLTRTTVVKKAEIMRFELIFRGHLGGSVWDKYLATGIVAGIVLPVSLKKWQALDFPLFTPSTKAAEGHDINITAAEFYEATGEAGRQAVEMLSAIYIKAYDFALARGIYILDTKFEAGFINGELYLCDEWLTPDSSRYVEEVDLEESIEAGREPAFMDKQPVRNYCAKIETPFFEDNGKSIVGFKDLDPKNPEHQQFVANYPFPEEIATATTERFLKIFQLLTGTSLQEYQEKYLL